jgi:hypothetical protein
MTSRTIVALTTAVATVGALLTTSAAAPPVAAPSGNPDPGLFKHPVENAFFPLTPGLVTRLRGIDEGERYREVVRVTDRTKVIAGVTTTVVRDVVRRVDGTPAEKTTDWYAADEDGNVWYFGEATATYDEDGRLEDTDGSWQAGVDGAVAGIVMPADPRPPVATRMEVARGEAEDMSWVVQRLPSVRTPGGTFDGIVRTLEWTRLEPGVVSMKFYARGLGIVFEKDLSGGDEKFWLVSSTKG